MRKVLNRNLFIDTFSDWLRPKRIKALLVILKWQSLTSNCLEKFRVLTHNLLITLSEDIYLVNSFPKRSIFLDNKGQRFVLMTKDFESLSHGVIFHVILCFFSALNMHQYLAASSRLFDVEIPVHDTVLFLWMIMRTLEQKSLWWATDLASATVASQDLLDLNWLLLLVLYLRKPKCTR